MTLEQEIRNSVERYEDLFGFSIHRAGTTLLVLADIDGVLKVEATGTENNPIILYLNVDKLYRTHEEAFKAEL